MSDETILSGYCRVLDQSRMDADCCYGACVHQTTCEIGKAITALLKAQQP